MHNQDFRASSAADWKWLARFLMNSNRVTVFSSDDKPESDIRLVPLVANADLK